MRIAYFNPDIHAQILASKNNETELFNLFSTGCYIVRRSVYVRDILYACPLFDLRTRL
jgi:hypothetical protein